MKKILLSLAATLLLCAAAFAQQALFGAASTASPVINEDGTVTFRLQDRKAISVQLTGEFLPTQKIETPRGTYETQGVVNLKEGENGVWEYTTEAPVKPELYYYSFLVDGKRVLDQSNVFVYRDVSTLYSVLLVPGDRADLYAIHRVPHGTVSKVWYPSKTAGFDRRLTVYTCRVRKSKTRYRSCTFSTASAETKMPG